jgi:hypothetical protein
MHYPTDDELEAEGPLAPQPTAEQRAAWAREYRADCLAAIDGPLDIEHARREISSWESDIFAHEIDGDGMAPSDVQGLWSFAENLLDHLEVAQAQLARPWWRRLLR